MIEEVQAEMVQYLKAALPGVQVELLPDQPLASKLTGPKGAVFINYVGGEYLSPEEFGAAGDPADCPLSTTLNIEIIVGAQGLHSAGGATGLLEVVQVLLNGWSPAGFLPMRLLTNRQFGCENNTWLYQAHFTVTQN